METTWESVDAFFSEHLGIEDQALQRASTTSEAEGLPPIQVSAPAGKLLELLVAMSGARSILEVGTLGGYSTICLARGAGPEGCIITLEIDQHHAEVAKVNLEFAGVDDRVAIKVGPALDSLELLSSQEGLSIDFSFIDADKENNALYVEKAIELSHPGSIIVVDNVVRDGGVIEEDSTNSQIIGTRAMISFVENHPCLEATAIQTVGSKGYDGFLLARVI